MPENRDKNTDPNDILIVDDEMPNLKLLSELLGGAGYQVRPTNDPQMAIDSALMLPPKLILLDVRIPDVDGFEVCRRLKQDERTREVPIIFISALQDLEDRVQGFEIGAVDFISKPFQEEEVLARVRTHMDLRNLQLNLEAIVDERTAELAKSETKYRGLVDNAIVGVFHSTIDGRFIFVNDAMARMFDFDNPEQMIGHGTVERWRDPQDRDRMLYDLEKYGQLTNFEAEAITHAGRSLHAQLTVKRIDDDIYGMVMDITARKQAEKKLLDYQQRLKALASQLTITEEKERLAIAADLHDHVGQSLALARVQIASVRKRITDPKQAATLDDVSASLRQTVKDTRHLIYNLSPPQLIEIGLSAAIKEWLQEYVEKRYEIKVQCILTPSEMQLGDTLKTVLFRNIRELVTNVIKHAKAGEISLQMNQGNDQLTIVVKDNGIGCDAKAVLQSSNSNGGFGLFSIRERMADLGGSLEILSEPGQGTTSILRVPVARENAGAKSLS